MEKAQEATSAENLAKGVAMASELKEKHLPKEKSQNADGAEFSDWSIFHQISVLQMISFGIK